MIRCHSRFCKPFTGRKQEATPSPSVTTKVNRTPSPDGPVSCPYPVIESQGSTGYGGPLHANRGANVTYTLLEGAAEVWSRDGLIAVLQERDAVVVLAGEPHRVVWLSGGAILALYHGRPGEAVDVTDFETLEPGWGPGEKKIVSRKPDVGGGPVRGLVP
jgi:hypothetical protein